MNEVAIAAARRLAAVACALAYAALAAASAALALVDSAIAAQAVERLLFQTLQSSAHVASGPADPVDTVSEDEGTPENK
jgi:hypothetical protein